MVGTGANFAVLRSAYDALGGFDEALGAGTLTRGGEDLDWFVRTLTGRLDHRLRAGRGRLAPAPPRPRVAAATSSTATAPASRRTW